jgi:hypothetical protein
LLYVLKKRSVEIFFLKQKQNPNWFCGGFKWVWVRNRRNEAVLKQRQGLEDKMEAAAADLNH